MKKFLFTLLALLAVTNLQAQDWKDLLKGVGTAVTGEGKEQQTTTQGTSNGTSTDGKSGSSLSGILGQLEGIGSALGIIPERSVDVEYLKGKWAYSKAAVAFKSDNFLKKAGGLVAAQKIESQLEPYYKRLGFNKMTLEVNADSTFTMAVGKIKLTGVITTDTKAKTLVFNFKALGGKMSTGSMAAYVNASNAKTMDITFDITKLIDLLSKVGSITGNSTVKAATNLLQSYDGLTAGFTMNKQ